MRQTHGFCRFVVLGESLLIPPGFPAAGLLVLHPGIDQLTAISTRIISMQGGRL